MVDRFTRRQKIDILLWELWNETSYPLPGHDTEAQCKQNTIKALLEAFKNGGHPRDEWSQWYAGLGEKADVKEPENTISMTRSEFDALKTHMADLERSAASAREIARAAMSSTGTRAIRAEMVVHSDGTIQVIVCDPAGDEIETARRVAKLMDAGILSSIGAKLTDNEPVPVGSMD